MSVLAHVGGVPVEELAPSVIAAGGAAALTARAWLALHLRRRRGDRRT